MARLPTPLAAALVCACLLAGCSGGDPPAPAQETNTEPSGDPGAAEPAVNAVPWPAWHVGQAWTLDAVYRVAPAMQITVVVVDILPDGTAVLGASDVDAGRSALFLHWPPLGPITPSGMAVKMHGLNVELARFPASDGATWQSDFRGETVSWTTGVAPDGLVTFVAVGGDEERLRAVYDPAIGWFRTLAYTFPGSGEPTHSWTLSQAHNAWTGNAFRFEWQDAVVDHSSPDEPTHNPTAQATIGDGWDTVLVGLFHGGGPGVVAATVTTPSGHSEYLGGPRADQPGTTLQWTALPSEAGDWHLAMLGGATDYDLFLEALAVREMAVQI